MAASGSVLPAAAVAASPANNSYLLQRIIISFPRIYKCTILRLKSVLFVGLSVDVINQFSILSQRERERGPMD